MVVCLVGAVLGLFIAGRDEHADEALAPVHDTTDASLDEAEQTRP
jgi:hypothetical protein